MKTLKLIFIICLSVLGFVAQAQNGLENIYVERYYVADAIDAANSSPAIPVGAVTYRIYADMLPGYKVQTIFGIPAHPMTMTTTTEFWNQADFGASIPTFSSTNAKKNTVMLDSWLTAGGACNGFNGVPKSEDNGVGNFVNTNVPQLLQNNAAQAGIPLTTQDGMLAGTVPTAGTLGIDPAMLDLFGDGTANGNTFLVPDGSWYCLAGAPGPIPATNRVLIAQITTDGIFHFELNIQIGTPTGGTENYVHSNPTGVEITVPFLTQTHYPAPQAPSVSITSPLAGATFAPLAPITLTATAADIDGTVTSVEFFVDGASVGFGTLSAGSYSLTLAAGLAEKVTPYVLTAKATDNDAQFTISAPVNINVGNAPPVATMTAPANGTVYVLGDNVTVSATAVDPDGTIASVAFYNNGVLIPGTVNLSAGVYSQGFTTSVLGANALTAVATDNLGKVGPVSAARTITVNANQLPSVAITAPVDGATPALADPLVLTATATDADGTIATVQFYNGATLLGNGVLASGVYTYTVPAASLVAGPMVLTAKATDDKGGVKTSTAVNVVITDFSAAYTFTFVNQECNLASVCMPIRTVSAVSGINGYNYTVKYDKTKVLPTGNITVSSALLSVPNAPQAGQLAEYYTDYTTTIDAGAGLIYIGIYFNANAGAGASFTGLGDVCCVEFNRAGIASTDVAVFSFEEIIESYPSGSAIFKQGTPGNLVSYADNSFAGSLKFWSDLSPIVYDVLNPTSYLVTDITKCGLTTPAVQPDMLGNFTYLLAAPADSLIDIKRDIAAATNVHPVITGQDSYIAALVSVKGELYVGWQPLVYQMIAMDVNRDGLVTAGDATQINQRAVSLIPQFSQIGGLGKDWSFVANDEVASNPLYLISTTYPENDGLGYSKYNVPVVDVCQVVPVVDALSCPIIEDENYMGVMIGDVDGSYTTAVIGGGVRSATADTSKIIIDLSHATFNGSLMSIPVSLTSSEVVHSFDFDLTINDLMASVQAVNSQYSIDYSWNYIAAAKRLSVAAFSLNAIPVDNTISIVLNVLTNEPITSEDLVGTLALVNGLAANMDIIDATTGTGDYNQTMVNIFPNPTSDKLNVQVSVDSKMQILDISGKQLSAEQTVNANQTHTVDVSNFAAGVYMVKIYNEKSVSMNKIIVRK